MLKEKPIPPLPLGADHWLLVIVALYLCGTPGVGKIKDKQTDMGKTCTLHTKSSLLTWALNPGPALRVAAELTNVHIHLFVTLVSGARCKLSGRTQEKLHGSFSRHIRWHLTVSLCDWIAGENRIYPLYIIHYIIPWRFQHMNLTVTMSSGTGHLFPFWTCVCRYLVNLPPTIKHQTETIFCLDPPLCCRPLSSLSPGDPQNKAVTGNSLCWREVNEWARHLLVTLLLLSPFSSIQNLHAPSYHAHKSCLRGLCSACCTFFF